ncbi:hypothetical protein [Shimia abyssi]|uniref:Tetratricopeptide repeat protein n=1 Tax=Shimia abyssi TaxID=1662395 RepID=A0A2P8FBU1_9RHOB|nr:hypothetical protein [Shimia abyssi]PSL19195.1 hypothetical protein CLV88_107138 [Shimia abyssi]
MPKFLAALFTCLTLTMTAAAQTTLDETMAELEGLFERGASEEEIGNYLAEMLRMTKASGVIDPDLSIFYAMLADHLRLSANNPAYALQVAEDGLALIAGNPAQLDFQATLLASRAYALADMGRFVDAHDALMLAIPTLALTFDEDAIAGYRADAEKWAEGQLSASNRSALDIARETMDAAYAAKDAGNSGRVLVLAGSALLPMDTSFPEGDLRAVNAEAEKLTAEALFDLGRNRESANAYLRALGYLTNSPWQLTGTPDWWGAAGPGSDVARFGFDILEGLARAATEFGREDVERAALAAALDLVESPRQRYALLQRQARILAAEEKVDEALALLEQALVIAQDADLELDAQVTEFYIAMVTAYGHLIAGEAFDQAEFVRVTDRLLETYETLHVTGRDFVLYSAARVLRHGTMPDKTLSYARQALIWRQTDLARKADTAFAATQGRRASRNTLELFLRSAHNAASAAEHPGQSIVYCPDDTAYHGCLIEMPPD